MGNQFVQFEFPPSGQSSNQNGSFLFVSNIPATDDFNSTFDAFQFIAPGGSRLSNYTSNGTSQGWDIETNSSQASVPYTSCEYVKVIWQYVIAGGCAASDHSDCVRLQLYS